MWRGFLLLRPRVPRVPPVPLASRVSSSAIATTFVLSFSFSCPERASFALRKNTTTFLLEMLVLPLFSSSNCSLHCLFYAIFVLVCLGWKQTFEPSPWLTTKSHLGTVASGEISTPWSAHALSPCPSIEFGIGMQTIPTMPSPTMLLRVSSFMPFSIFLHDHGVKGGSKV